MFRWYRGDRSSLHSQQATQTAEDAHAGSSEPECWTAAYACVRVSVCACRGLCLCVRACMCALIKAGCDWCRGGGLSGAGRDSNTIHATARESDRKSAGQLWMACHMATPTDTRTHIAQVRKFSRRQMSKRPSHWKNVSMCVGMCPMTLVYYYLKPIDRILFKLIL